MRCEDSFLQPVCLCPSLDVVRSKESLGCRHCRLIFFVDFLERLAWARPCSRARGGSRLSLLSVVTISPFPSLFSRTGWTLTVSEVLHSLRGISCHDPFFLFLPSLCLSSFFKVTFVPGRLVGGPRELLAS